MRFERIDRRRVRGAPLERRHRGGGRSMAVPGRLTRRLISTGVSLGLNLKAFSMRLDSTCSIRRASRSARTGFGASTVIVRPRPRSDEIHHGEEQLTQIHHVADERQLAVVESRRVHQAVHQPGQLDGLLIDAQQRELHVLRRNRRAALDLAQDQLREAAHRRGRRPQLVRGNRDHVVDLLQLLFERGIPRRVGDLDADAVGDLRAYFNRRSVVPIRSFARAATRRRCCRVLQRRAHHRAGRQMREVAFAPPAHLAAGRRGIRRQGGEANPACPARRGPSPRRRASRKRWWRSVWRARRAAAGRDARWRPREGGRQLASAPGRTNRPWLARQMPRCDPGRCAGLAHRSAVVRPRPAAP